MTSRRFSSLLLVALLTQPVGAEQQAPVTEEIRAEAVRPNHGAAGRPLPLAAHWNVTGMYMEGFTPAYQLELLKKGHHILPWLEWPPTDRDLETLFKPGDPRKQKYIDGRMKDFEKAVKELARLKLPISFLANQRGTVLELDGRGDRVEINNSPDINAAGAYRERTIAFWFRAREADKSDRKKVPRQVLYEEGGPGSGLNLYLDGAVLHAGTWVEGKGAWLRSKELPSAWHHVALVLRADNKCDVDGLLELYLNGERVAAGKAPLLAAHPGDINLGRCGNTLFHDGQAADAPGFYLTCASSLETMPS